MFPNGEIDLQEDEKDNQMNHSNSNDIVSISDEMDLSNNVV